MLVLILNRRSEVSFVHSAYPKTVNQGLGLQNLRGSVIELTCTEFAQTFGDAVTNCFESRVDQHCEVCLLLGQTRSRWRMQMVPFSDSELMITGTALPVKLGELSERELEVLRHIAQERSTKDIAEWLGISKSTVEKHRHRIRRVLGISSSLKMAVLSCVIFRADCMLLSPTEESD